MLWRMGLTIAEISASCEISRSDVIDIVGIEVPLMQAGDIIHRWRRDRGKRDPVLWHERYCRLIRAHGHEVVKEVIDHAKRDRFYHTKANKIRDRWSPAWVYRHFDELKLQLTRTNDRKPECIVRVFREGRVL